MKETISVIVPVYNVAAYLPQCLDSILSQDYGALEVLLIDDGSTDDSGAICDAYAARDGRVRAVHQKNGGAAAAKNAGLRLATGGYLSFVDSDDYLEPGAYSYMVSVLEENGADAAQFAFRYVGPKTQEDKVVHPNRETVSGLEFLRRFPYDWTGALLWDKLYRRRLFQGVFFEEGHKIDDEFFTYQGFLNAGAVTLDSRVIYNYRRRASSVMLSAQARAQRSLDRIQALRQRRETVAAREPRLKKDYDIQYLDALCYMAKYPDNTEESIALLKRCLGEYLRKPGNTLPPKHFWRDMWALLTADAQTLLARYGREPEAEETEDCFP